MYKGIGTIIKTNIGDFGSFNDLLKFMEEEKIFKIFIDEMKIFAAPVDFDNFKGEYTLNEIKKIIKI